MYIYLSIYIYITFIQLFIYVLIYIFTHTHTGLHKCRFYIGILQKFRQSLRYVVSSGLYFTNRTCGIIKKHEDMRDHQWEMPDSGVRSPLNMFFWYSFSSPCVLSLPPVSSELSGPSIVERWSSERNDQVCQLFVEEYQPYQQSWATTLMQVACACLRCCTDP